MTVAGSGWLWNFSNMAILKAFSTPRLVVPVMLALSVAISKTHL
jgi:hypothetical protein